MKLSYFKQKYLIVLKAFRSAKCEGIPALSNGQYRWRQDRRQSRGQLETCVSG